MLLRVVLATVSVKLTLDLEGVSGRWMTSPALVELLLLLFYLVLHLEVVTTALKLFGGGAQ